MKKLTKEQILVKLEAIECRLIDVENKLRQVHRGFDFITPIITPLPEDYPINNTSKQKEGE